MNGLEIIISCSSGFALSQNTCYENFYKFNCCAIGSVFRCRLNGISKGQNALSSALKQTGYAYGLSPTDIGVPFNFWRSSIMHKGDNVRTVV